MHVNTIISESAVKIMVVSSQPTEVILAKPKTAEEGNRVTVVLRFHGSMVL